MTRVKTWRTCKNGHRYQKSSDCPVCAVCENEREPDHEFLSELNAPARRALENAGIDSLTKLSKFRESEILSLHGMGPSSIPKLKSALKRNKLTFKK